MDSQNKLADAGLLVLRLVFGISLAWLHGRGKLANAAGYVFSGRSWDFVNVVAGLGFPLPGVFAVAAALAESIGAALMAIGLAARLGAFFVVFTMTVAISLHLRAGQSPELATLYWTPGLAIVLTGPGRYSLDALLLRKRDPKTTAQAAAAAN
jgi:putative oxidoreductase